MEDIKVVCTCLNITVQDITNAIENGAKSFEEVQAATNVSTGCGKCIDSVKELVDELLA
ncbi:(2Fe-2S)-binding protein [Clostridium lacusfryxellense]|uniref:(2Fe-2S)-binding protein n=1 Tax=Clostridium lacusfryxellense TaxID=205328 RepID=UPI001C0AA0E9|nr:(2Fe-2S)-binding protein [Clostridium lacusfryxellense]MBU3110208.1 (2Fe-2S)-binding protein [Clostridium lacusfryxellense]